MKSKKKVNELCVFVDLIWIRPIDPIIYREGGSKLMFMTVTSVQTDQNCSH